MNIDLYNIKTWKENFEKNENNEFIQNALTENSLRKLYTNRTLYQQNKHIYNYKVTPDVKVTNQKSSGRCWLFAALNVMRRDFIAEYSLPSDFEFSQSYLFFWDKLERMNYNMECIIDTYSDKTDSRIVHHLLDDPTCDGGQWDMFCSLINKYGIVPKSVYKETFHSSSSRGMNTILKKMFRETACLIRKTSQEDVNERQRLKYVFLESVYGVLCKFLGTPPSNFTWEYEDKTGKYNKIENVTPGEFYKQHVPFNCDDYICVVNDVRKENPFHQLYTVKYLGNVADGNKILYLNVPNDELKELAFKSIKNNKAVWFGCDVGQSLQHSECSMDLDLVDYEKLFGFKFNLNKEERVNYRDSLMTHAMVLSGVNTSKKNNCVNNDENETINKWQVENSWSADGVAKGYYMMTDDWFTEYVYELAIPKSSLTKEQKKILENNEIKELQPWDPMGSLAK